MASLQCNLAGVLGRLDEARAAVHAGLSRSGFTIARFYARAAGDNPS